MEQGSVRQEVWEQPQWYNWFSNWHRSNWACRVGSRNTAAEVQGAGELRQRREKAEQVQQVGEDSIKGEASWVQEKEVQATGGEHLSLSSSAEAAGAVAQARDTTQRLEAALQPPPPELQSAPAAQQGQVGADARCAPELPVYRGRAVLRTLLCKIPGCHLSDIPPGHERRLADAIDQPPPQHQQQQ